MGLMFLVKKHYDLVAKEIECDSPVDFARLAPPLVVVPMDRWSRVTQKGLRFALVLSPDVWVVHVQTDDQSDPLPERWRLLVEDPARQAGRKPPELVSLPSPYRFVVFPILNYVLQLVKSHPERYVAVLIPELVERRWYTNLLHNHRSAVLKALLLFKGDKRVMVINIPWYLKD